VVVLFWIFGALLASCGLGLVGLGTAMLAESNEAGAVGVLCGPPVCFGAYLFARAAVRARRDLHEHPLSEPQRRSRRTKLRFLVGYTASLIIGAIALPVPGTLRVIMVIAALLVVPPILALEFEPAKKRKPSGG
jgi:hypothetical protein